MVSKKKSSNESGLQRRIAELEQQVAEQTNLDRFRLVFEAAPNGIIVANESGRIAMVNQRAEKMFGYSREEFLKLSIDDLLPHRFRKNHSKYRGTYHSAPETREMGADRELFALKKNGTEFPVEIGLTPIPDHDELLIISSILDITERKNANAKMEFQAEILKNVSEAVFYLRPDGEILDWNEGAERVFGIAQEDAAGHNFFALLDEKTVDVFKNRLFPGVIEKGSASEVIRCQLRNGRDFFLRAKGTRLRQNRDDGFIICASDITEQKRLEAKIVSISENEQRRIGQDLHDDLCSQLSGIACITKAMETRFAQHQKEEFELMAKVSEMVSAAVTKTQKIAKGLIPAVLENQGLKSALEDLVSRNREVYGVNCQLFHCNESIAAELPNATSIQLYRIAQEAINNAVKHSEAAKIEINLSETHDGRAKLSILDNGKGMPSDLVSAGLGLLTMRQRAEMIGADFEIHAKPKHGTEITCIVSTHPIIHE